MRLPLPALLVAALATLIGCSKPPEQTTATEAGNDRVPAQAELERLRTQGPEPALQALRPLDYWLHY